MQYPEEQLLDQISSIKFTSDLFSTPQKQNQVRQWLNRINPSLHTKIIDHLIENMSETQPKIKLKFIWMLQIWQSGFQENFYKIVTQIVSQITKQNASSIINDIIRMIILKSTHILVPLNFTQQKMLQILQKLSECTPKIPQMMQIHLQPLFSHCLTFSTDQTFDIFVVFYYLISIKSAHFSNLQMLDQQEYLILQKWQNQLLINKNKAYMLEFIAYKMLVYYQQYSQLPDTKIIIFSICVITITTSTQYNHILSDVLFNNYHRFFLHHHPGYNLFIMDKKQKKSVMPMLYKLRQKLFRSLCHTYLIFEIKGILNYLQMIIKDGLTASMVYSIHQLMKPEYLTIYASSYNHKQFANNNINASYRKFQLNQQKNMYIKKIQNLLQIVQKHSPHNKFVLPCHENQPRYISISYDNKPIIVDIGLQIISAFQYGFPKDKMNFMKMQTSNRIIRVQLQFIYNNNVTSSEQIKNSQLISAILEQSKFENPSGVSIKIHLLISTKSSSQYLQKILIFDSRKYSQYSLHHNFKFDINNKNSEHTIHVNNQFCYTFKSESIDKMLVGNFVIGQVACIKKIHKFSYLYQHNPKIIIDALKQASKSDLKYLRSQGSVIKLQSYEDYAYTLQSIRRLFMFLLSALTEQYSVPWLDRVLVDLIQVIRKQLIALNVDKFTSLYIEQFVKFVSIAIIWLSNQNLIKFETFQKLIFALSNLLFPWASHEIKEQNCKAYYNQLIQKDFHKAKWLQKYFEYMITTAIQFRSKNIWRHTFYAFDRLIFIFLNKTKKGINMHLSKQNINRLIQKSLYWGLLVSLGHIMHLQSSKYLKNLKQLFKIITQFYQQCMYSKMEKYQHLVDLLKFIGVALCSVTPSNAIQIGLFISEMLKLIDNLIVQIFGGDIGQLIPFLKNNQQKLIFLLSELYSKLPKFGCALFIHKNQQSQLNLDDYYQYFIKSVKLPSHNFEVHPSYISTGDNNNINGSQSSIDSFSSSQNKNQDEKSEQKYTINHSLIFHISNKLLKVGNQYLFALNSKIKNKRKSMSQILLFNSSIQSEQNIISQKSFQYLYLVLCFLDTKTEYFDWGDEITPQNDQISHRITLQLMAKSCWEYFLEKTHLKYQYDSQEYLLYRKLTLLEYPVLNKQIIMEWLKIYLLEFIPLNDTIIKFTDNQINAAQAKNIVIYVMQQTQHRKSNNFQKKFIQILRIFSNIRFSFPDIFQPCQVNNLVEHFHDPLIISETKMICSICFSLDILESMIELSTSRFSINTFKAGLMNYKKIINILDSFQQYQLLGMIGSQNNRNNLKEIKNILVQKQQLLKSLNAKFKDIKTKIVIIFQKHMSPLINFMAQLVNNIDNKSINQLKRAFETNIQYIHAAITVFYQAKQKLIQFYQHFDSNQLISSRKQSTEVSKDGQNVKLTDLHLSSLQDNCGLLQNFHELNSYIIRKKTEIIQSYHRLVQMMDTELQIHLQQYPSLKLQKDIFAKRFGLYQLDNRLNNKQLKFILQRNYRDLTNKQWQSVPLQSSTQKINHLKCALYYQNQVNNLIKLLQLKNELQPLYNKNSKSKSFNNITLITVSGVYQGTLETSKNQIKFTQSTHINQRLYKQMHILMHQKRTQEKILNYRKMIRMNFKQIIIAYKKKYLHYYPAIQIFLPTQSHFFVFPNQSNLKMFISDCNIQVVQSKPEQLRDKIKDTLYNLKKGHINNFDYITEINNIGGRTINDPSQYYIFPWTLFQLPKKNMLLQTIRDLELPIGKINPQRFKIYSDSFNQSKKYQNIGQQPFLYGTFYSNPAFLFSYMLRVKPFTQHHTILHGGNFDCFDRLFMSYDQECKSVYNHTGHLCQLIPEFYYFPEFLRNRNLCKFTSLKVQQNFKLPEWVTTQTPQQFIFRLRECLQSEEASKKLNCWISLIFGYKSQLKKAGKYDNLYRERLYKDYKCGNDKQTCFFERKQFGQVPRSILKQEEFQNLKTFMNHNKTKQYQDISEQKYQPNKYQFPDESNPLQMVIQNQCLLVLTQNHIFLENSFSNKFHKTVSYEVKSVRKIVCCEYMHGKNQQRIYLVFLLNKNQLQVQMMCIRKRKAGIIYDKFQFQVVHKQCLVTGNKITQIGAYKDRFIWTDGDTIQCMKFSSYLNQTKHNQVFKTITLQKQPIYFSKLDSIYCHRCLIHRLQINKNNGLLVCCDTNNVISVVTIGKHIKKRAIFQFPFKQQNDYIRQILIHDMGIIMFLTAKMNKIVVTNYYGDLVLILCLKPDFIQQILFADSQSDSKIIILTKSSIYQGKIFDMISDTDQFIKLNSNGGLVRQINLRNLQGIKMQSFSEKIKKQQKNDNQMLLNKTIYISAKMIRVGRNWKMLILCSDGTVDVIAPCQDIDSILMDTKVRIQMNMNYQYKNMSL